MRSRKQPPRGVRALTVRHAFVFWGGMHSCGVRGTPPDFVRSTRPAESALLSSRRNCRKVWNVAAAAARPFPSPGASWALPPYKHQMHV